MKPAILITAYRQLELTNKHIQCINNEYKTLNKLPIIVVTTAEDGGGFKSLESKFKNVYVIEFKDAPSPDNFTPKTNSFSDPKSRSPKTLTSVPTFQNGFIPGGTFRYEYLPARVLFSIEKGLKKAIDLGIDVILHLHSDTYWLPELEENLVTDLKFVLQNDIMLYGDCVKDADAADTLPRGFFFHPEGLIFNIKECQKYQYGTTFSKAFQSKNSNGILLDENDFFTDWGGTEILLGTWAHWCLTHKNLYRGSTVADIERIYFSKVKVRMWREAHGRFPYGLVNIPGSQDEI